MTQAVRRISKFTSSEKIDIVAAITFLNLYHLLFKITIYNHKLNHAMPTTNEINRPPDQIGYVFSDIEDSLKLFTHMYDVQNINRFDFKIDQHWVHGKQFPIHLDIALFVIGDLEYEIIQPLSDGPHQWFLDKTGGGLNHLGYFVNDFSATRSHLENAGMTLLMNAETDVYKPGEDNPDHRITGGYFEYTGNETIWIEALERKPY
jgi:hypothetical protein